jgi:hypothetical protein
VKDKNGDFLADSDNILNRWKNYYPQLLNVRIRQVEIHAAEPLVLGPFEVEIAIAKLKNCNLPGSDQIPAELIQARGKTLL